MLSVGLTSDFLAASCITHRNDENCRTACRLSMVKNRGLIRIKSDSSSSSVSSNHNLAPAGIPAMLLL